MGQNQSAEDLDDTSHSAGQTPRDDNTSKRHTHEFYVSNGDLETVGDLDSILQAISITPKASEEQGGRESYE